MNSYPSVSSDENHLGELAIKFRGTRCAEERQAIARDYFQTVNRLIQSCRWQEIPPPEDQLPTEYMPQAFFEYWSPSQNPS